MSVRVEAVKNINNVVVDNKVKEIFFYYQKYPKNKTVEVVIFTQICIVKWILSKLTCSKILKSK